MRVTPFRTAQTPYGRLRFFGPQKGGPDLPWTSLGDLIGLLGLGSEDAEGLLRKLRRDWDAIAATVATDCGIETLVPHFAAKGLLDAWSEAGECDSEVPAAYVTHGARAARLMVSDLGVSDRLAYMFSAFGRWDAHDTSFTV